MSDASYHSGKRTGRGSYFNRRTSKKLRARDRYATGKPRPLRRKRTGQPVNESYGPANNATLADIWPSQ